MATNVNRYFNKHCLELNAHKVNPLYLIDLMVKMIEADKIYSSEFIGNLLITAIQFN